MRRTVWVASDVKSLGGRAAINYIENLFQQHGSVSSSWEVHYICIFLFAITITVCTFYTGDALAMGAMHNWYWRQIGPTDGRRVFVQSCSFKSNLNEKKSPPRTEVLDSILCTCSVESVNTNPTNRTYSYLFTLTIECNINHKGLGQLNSGIKSRVIWWYRKGNHWSFRLRTLSYKACEMHKYIGIASSFENEAYHLWSVSTQPQGHDSDMSVFDHSGLWSIVTVTQ